MKLMQKIFTIFLLFTYFIITISNVSALTYINNDNDKDKLIKEIITLKVNIKKIPSGDKYIKSIDNFISKIKNNKEKLELLQIKISKLQEKLSNTTQNTKIKNYSKIINYINSKITLELYKIESINKITQQKKSEIELKNKFEEIKNPNLSESEIKLVNDKLINIQLNLLENASYNIKSLTKDFDKLSNYEQKGDFKFDFGIDHDLIGKFNTKLELKDYTSKVSGFDSQFSGQLEAIINAIPKGEDEIKLKLSTFVDFITKDNNIYLLIDKFNITDQAGIDNFKDQLEILKKFAEQNKYITIDDENSKEIFENLKSINPNKLLTDSREILSEPMFKAYKKQGNKYLLIPTKYACDKYKELQAKFDPWNGSSCSQGQYDSMLEELVKYGDLYIELGTKNKLGFDSYSDKNVETFNSYIVFTDTSIEEINSELVVTGNEGFKLDYIKNNKLNFNLNAGKNAQGTLESKLDRNNKFSYINLNYNAKGFYDEFEAKLKLQDKKITGDFKFISQKYDGYDYETNKSKYKPGNIISGNITGKQDYKNKLQNLDIQISGVDADTDEQFLNAKLNKNYNNYDASINVSDNNITIFDTNLKLYNKNITGTTSISDFAGKQIAKIISNGKYETDFFKLNNKIKISESLLDIYTSQIAKARDTVRISNLTFLQTSLEQYFIDMGEYPTKIVGNEELLKYIWKTPTDPSGNIEINGCKFGYYYEVGKDEYGIENGSYKLSSCMETKEKFIIGNGQKDFRADKGFYINGYTTWVKKETENKETKIEANLNMSIDVRNNKNNSNLYIDYLEDNNKMIELEIDNKGTKKYKKINIEAPENTMDINEAMGLK